jgi:hypothetical protein
LVLPILYVGTLPMVWLLASPTKGSVLQKFYEPVFHLMEHTPLRTPLLAWSSAWGVREKIERQLERREMDRVFDVNERGALGPDILQNGHP